MTELDGGGGATSNWDLWDSGCNSAYRNWQVGEPNNDSKYTGAEDCAALTGEAGTADLFWYDTPCEMEALLRYPDEWGRGARCRSGGARASSSAATRAPPASG